MDCGDQKPLEPIDNVLAGLEAMAAPAQDERNVCQLGLCSIE